MINDAADDQGFTLVELLVAIVITGIIAASLGSALIVGLKTTGLTSTRLDESHDTQQLTTYLPADLQSVQEGGVDTSSASGSGCAPAGNESDYTSWRNVLKLTWTQSLPAPAHTFTAAYRVGQRVAVPQDWRLIRYACQDGAAATAVLMSYKLKDPSITPPTVDVSQPPNVTVGLTEASGYGYKVSGTRRTPDATPTTPVPWQCTVLSAVAIPDPAVRSTVAAGPLLSDEQFKVQSGGVCSGLKLTLNPGGSPARTLALVESPLGSGAWQLTVPKSADLWTDGDKTAPVTDASGTLATVRFSIRSCVLSGLTATPNPVRRAPGAAPGPLASDVSFSVTSTGACVGLAVTYAPQPGLTATTPLTETTPGTWTGTAIGTAATWIDGAHLFSVAEPSGPVLASATLVVTPNCVISPAPTASPNPAQVGVGSLNNTLTSDIAIALTSTGTCTGLQITFTPGSAGPSVVPLTAGAAGAWSGSLSGSAYVWTKGTKTLNFTDSAGNPLASVDLVVN